MPSKGWRGLVEWLVFGVAKLGRVRGLVTVTDARAYVATTTDTATYSVTVNDAVAYGVTVTDG